MRDPKRIAHLGGLFSLLWMKMPDMRFFQMIDYIKGELPEGTTSTIYYHPPSWGGDQDDRMFEGRDAFNTEDDITIATLRRLLDELG